ncbi:Gag-Pol polyprotein [Vitis vinifera]|uniref:Gag-Pol polyprotein n=1 Tax=Vitis vinifera TaxID=29760 RepID=A0A438HJL6_VITVI|nr:Gag-Pol polyprotein [Vitis vinifera]
MVSARFRRHSRGLRNNFATPSYLHRAAKLASTLRFPASFSRHKSGIVRRRNITLFKKATKSLRNKRVISQHFAKCFLQLGVIGFAPKVAATTVIKNMLYGRFSLLFLLAIRIYSWKVTSKLCPRFLKALLRLDLLWILLVDHGDRLLPVCSEVSECQIHGDPIHVPPSELHALTSPWPFSVWGIDIIGKISPKSSSGHEFILVAIDYFTKWVEAASYARLTSSGVASFIRSHIICRYGVPYELISDRGVHFRAEVDTLVQRYSIRHHRSSTYRPQTNGAVEAANKNIKRILRRMVETSRDWSEKLPFALWAYRTSFHTSTGATPYSLVYGMEAMLPVEIEMGSLRVSLEQQIPETDWAQARFDQLNLLDERRLRAAYHVRAYQRKMARSFKKRVRPRPLRIGDLVLKVVRGLIRDPRGKFRPNWSGPYFIRELTPESAAWLMDLDGNRFSEPTNVDQLKSDPSQVRCSLRIIITHITISSSYFICLLIDIIFTLGILSFLSFLSPYHLDLRYVPCLKTTLRPWDQMSSSAASTWTGLIQLCSDYQDREFDDD